MDFTKVIIISHAIIEKDILKYKKTIYDKTT